MSLANRPIVILGMQRSGTSAVSGALARLGLHLGNEHEFFASDANNSAGYFEQRLLTVFNHKCLTLFQMHVAGGCPLPENWKAYPQAQILAAELKALIISSFSDKPVWGFKQPIASLLMPLYDAVFTELGLEPQFIVCVRNPIDVKASEANWVYTAGARQMAPLGSNAIGAWLRYTVGALKATQGSPRTVIPYAHFTATPLDYLQRVAKLQPNWKPSDEQWAAALTSVQPNLRHHAASEGALSHYPPIVQQLFDFCTDCPEDRTRLQGLIDEYEQWQAMLAPQKPSGTRIGLAWHSGRDVKSVQVPFLPTGDWQRVQMHLECPPNTAMNGLLYNKPCRVWIQRAVFLTPSGEVPAKINPGPGSQLNNLYGVLRLDGAYESQQINLTTPAVPGPYTLELEILMESGQQISNDAASRLADRLHQCSARADVLRRQSGRTI